jgi:hypothetical protein
MACVPDGNSNIEHVGGYTKTAPQEDALDASGYTAVCGMLDGHNKLAADDHRLDRMYRTFECRKGKELEKASSGLRLMLCNFG